MRAIQKLILFASLLCSQDAFSYGAVPSVYTDWGESYLFSPALKNREIRYCLQIADPVRFPPESVKAQIESALGLWLRAVPFMQQTLADHVKLTEVECNSTSKNLEVVIAPQMVASFAKLKAFQQAQREKGRYYSRVVINSGELSDGYQFLDTTTLFAKYGFSAREVVQFFETGRYEFDSLSKFLKVDPIQLFWTTYKVLIHELGHSFGLCDTYEGQVAYCDGYLNGHIHGDSVMKTSNQFYLTAEDIEGIRELAQLFMSDRSASYIKSMPFRKPAFVLRTTFPKFK